MITWIIGQAIVNIATVNGLLRVIGVPLAFISYGGSAMVSSLAGIGIILGVTGNDSSLRVTGRGRPAPPARRGMKRRVNGSPSLAEQRRLSAVRTGGPR